MEVMAALAVGEADGAADGEVDGEVDGAVDFGLPMVQVVIFFNLKQFYKIFLNWQSLGPTLLSIIVFYKYQKHNLNIYTSFVSLRVNKTCFNLRILNFHICVKSCL